MIFALALIHHLAISNNVPLSQIAEYLASSGRWLAIEFVPKSDSQVQKLLRTREDIFDRYTKDGFEQAFEPYYSIQETIPLKDSERILYLMQKQG